MEIKIGDRVQCIEASTNGYPGIVGKVYTVKDVVKGTEWHLYLETDEPCSTLACSAKRFKLYTGSDVSQWFDDHLKEPPKKKERVPDELDWEKHKAFMRSLR